MSITSVKSGATGISLALDNNFMEPIATTLVGSGGANTIIFNDIPQTYKHLQLRTIVRSQGAGGDYNAIVNFNSDATVGNYPLHYLFGNGTSVVSGYSANDTGIAIARSTGAGSTASMYGVGIADILDYTNTSKYKTVRILLGSERNDPGIILFNSGLWLNTNAINSMTITVGGGNLAQYSRVSLYGIKG
jgi:hypothetical protein